MKCPDEKGAKYSNFLSLILHFFSTASKYAEIDEIVLTKVPDTYDLEFINEMKLKEWILLD